MIADVLTVARKEWTEYIATGTGLKGGRMGLIVMLAVFGVFLPAQNGPTWLTSPIPLVMWAWVPLMLVSGVVADSFAGERERHTLETLLASRLSDEAILLGKVGAATVYGWAFAVLAAALSVVSVNVFHWQGHAVFFPAAVATALPVFSLLTSLLAASAGVLVSLRAPTARHAAQALSISVMVILFVPMFTIRALPEDTRNALAAAALRFDARALMAAAALGMLLVDGALLAAGFLRFRRSRLTLD